MNGGAFGQPEDRLRITTFLVCLVVAFNLLLIGLRWSPWFAGTEQQIGCADRLFGAYRLGGFRADCVWLFFSTAILVIALCYFLLQARRRNARIAVLLCVIDILAFCAYVYRILTTGLL